MPFRRSVLPRQLVVAKGAGAGPIWPNLPAGYTNWFDVNWSVFTPTNWSWAFTSDSGDGTVAGSASLISDPTAPMDPPSVLQFSYPTGFTAGGYEPAKVVFDDPDLVSPLPKHLYIGWIFKVSNPWQGHDSGVNKIFFALTATSPGNSTIDWFPVEMYGEGANGIAPFRFRVSLFETNITEPENWAVANLDTTPISLGVWHKMELLMGFSTSSTSQDGTIDMWNDGIHVMSYSNINYPNAGFGEFQIAPTWGGVDSPYPTGAKTENDFFWIDHITGWVKRSL